ncbi:FkbM family methyltransferase [Winogradskyella echinorum]|uniref:FkbM family methyltransferase n=1 Tax=Winogradskyella echinorum TaxID=538189 RepID=A0ABR6Y0F6_9FLAO|nr:FkbM family methyltransferase [Winogradskyella echinorum]MBC3845733.1 FkbM family methyltransferase [Winogradskyella echinorum]MBC5750081.1 FkbM family methyltransferase [Winogradskyella echinorum]
MTYNSFLKRLFIVLKTKWLLNLIKGRVFSFASFDMINNLYKIESNLTTIIDVGANKGQFQKAANYFYPSANIYSFEPIPELFEGLVKVSNNNITNYNFALGNEKGELDFQKNKYFHISSFLDISKKNTDYPKNDVEIIKVQIRTLDDMHEELNIHGKTLLKLDVQGFEVEALKGAVNTLKKIDYIIVESNFEELYKNQPSYTELNAFLNLHNFEMRTMLDFNMGKDGNYIEADFLYKKR